jgi:O-antigen ligase
MFKIDTIRKLLAEYSPLGLLLIALSVFLPVDSGLALRLMLLFCALPGLLRAALEPKIICRQPVLLLIGLFTAFFSVQHLCGMLPLDTHILRMSATTAALIIGPACLLSRMRPDRKLYPAVMQLIVLAAAVRIGYELVHFYSNAPFPLARFAGLGHPVTGSRITGFAAILAGALFLQSGPDLKRRDWLPLLAAPLFLAAALYSHTRSTALAIAVTAAASLPGIKTNAKKTVILLAVAGLTVAAYTASVQLAPEPARRAKHTASKDFSQPASKEKKPSRKRKYAVRQGGVLTTDKRGLVSAHARLDIWKDHLSRINTPKDWLIGKGLGMNAFVMEPQPAATHWYQWTEHGWQLNVHSGYVWALYHGGLIGLGLLLVLLAAAFAAAVRAGSAGLVPAALIIFCGVCLLFNSQRLLVDRGPDYLMFWVPLALAAAFPLKKH